MLGGEVAARCGADAVIEAIVPDEEREQEPEGGREPRAPRDQPTYRSTSAVTSSLCTAPAVNWRTLARMPVEQVGHALVAELRRALEQALLAVLLARAG